MDPAVLRADPGEPVDPAAGRKSLPPILGQERREVVEDRVPLPRIFFGFRAPALGDERLDATTWRPRSWPAGRAAGFTAGLRDERIAQDVVGFSLGFVAGASIWAGWATVRPGVSIDHVERWFIEELDRIGREPISDDELARAHALIETEELGALQRVEERADRLSMYATLFDDPDLINRMLGRYLSVIRTGSAPRPPRCSGPTTGW